jgi:hypothetical protein
MSDGVVDFEKEKRKKEKKKKEEEEAIAFVTEVYGWFEKEIDSKTGITLKDFLVRRGFEKADYQKFKDQVFFSGLEKFKITPSFISNALQGIKKSRVELTVLKEKLPLTLEDQRRAKEVQKKLQKMLVEAGEKKEEKKEDEKRSKFYFYECYDIRDQNFCYECKGKLEFYDFIDELKKEYPMVKIVRTRNFKRRGEDWTVGYESLR